jgi:replicative DNA helicase
MSAKQRTRRDVSALTGIPVKRLKQRNLTKHEWKLAMDAAGRISELKIITDETPAQNPSQIRAACNRVVSEYGRLDLIELDYFQLCQADKPTSNRVQDLEGISKELVTIIKDFDVPLIGTAQVTSKAIAQRATKEPDLTDVFGSSALLKDGYFISFIYRDEYYNPDTTTRPGQAELIVRAHRDGDTPRINLQFDGPTAQFRNLARS